MGELSTLFENIVNEMYMSNISFSCYFCMYTWDVLEHSDIQWCTGELYSGRMGFAGSFPEESLQRCDAGDMQEPHCYR